MLTRVSPSFLRVGQLELHAKEKSTDEFATLFGYVLWRDFGDYLDCGTSAVKQQCSFGGIFDENQIVHGKNDKDHYSSTSTSTAAIARNRAALRKLITVHNLKVFFVVFAHRQALLHADWLRVGYVQGNMNSDNALLCGYSVDYGPFGFLDGPFRSKWCPWVGGGDKFSYSQQPLAGKVILSTLARRILRSGKLLEILAENSENHASEEDSDNKDTINKRISKQNELENFVDSLVDRYMKDIFRTYHDANARARLGFGPSEQQVQEIQLLYLLTDAHATVDSQHKHSNPSSTTGPSYHQEQEQNRCDPACSSSARLALLEKRPRATAARRLLAEFESSSRFSPRTARAASSSNKKSAVLKLYDELETLMERENMDFIFTLRGLSDVRDGFESSYQILFDPQPFRRSLGFEVHDRSSEAGSGETLQLPQAFRKWLLKWRDLLAKEQGLQMQRSASSSISSTTPSFLLPPETRRTMKQTSPSLTPRNWILTEAYEAAERGNFSLVQELYELFAKGGAYHDYPEDTRWVRTTPPWAREKAGVHYMS
ncbi:unnamed protein product [Amoebophrya sp. A25]|nr:unnamed protein product [Amoebophrya sp. A25]|eukprot:GSA25T00006092001.1